MIDYQALLKISYGLYIVSSGDRESGNGFISNSVFQVTSEPAVFTLCCNKNNYTEEFIDRSGAFAVSVLHTEAPQDLFIRFGYKTGKDFSKLEGMDIRYGETGVPVVLNGSVAFLEFRVIQKIDVGTHFLFIGELVQTEILDDEKEPMTYAWYRKNRKGVSPKNAPTYIDRAKLQPKKAG
jgi:flavin reductase (DIM6/NTAB) family NADH-FMN oxidoreductase RutF